MCIVNKNVFVVLLGELKVVEYDELSEVQFRNKGSYGYRCIYWILMYIFILVLEYINYKNINVEIIFF